MMLVVDLPRTKLGIAFAHPLAKEDEPYHRATLCQVYGLMEKGAAIKIAEGVAKCSVLDNFRKATGRKLALARALSKLTGLTREERQKVWETYLHRRVEPTVAPTPAPLVRKDVSGNVIEGP